MTAPEIAAWSRAEVIALRRLAERGADPATIALQLNRPEAAIRRKASEEGVRLSHAPAAGAAADGQPH